VLDLKIKRAKKHLDDLAEALRIFHEKGDRQFIARDRNPQTGDEIVKVVRVPQVPPMISCIIGDVLQNLRCALDHMVYALVAKQIAPKIPPTYVSFPIADSPDKYMSAEYRRKIELAGEKAVKRIDAIKPYKGGNDLLWQIGKLNNVDKHRLLVTTAMRYKHRTFTRDDLDRMSRSMPKGAIGILELLRYTNFGGPTNLLKVGDIVYAKPPHVKEKISFTFEVGFDEPEIIKCASVAETLYLMLKLVENNILPRFADLL
jgi:hypothetical protein